MISRKRAKEKFNSMSPEQRQKLESRYQRFKILSPEQQQQLKERRKWFQSLPKEDREEYVKFGIIYLLSSVER